MPNAVPTPGPEASSGTSAGLIGAAIAVTVWGGSGVLAKWIPLGALAIVAWRFGLYALLAGGWQAVRGHRLSAAAFRASLLGGLLLSADVALFFTAIKLTTVVNATIIGSLQPLLLTAYGVRFLGERVARRDVALGLLALGGVILIVTAGTNSGDASLWGDLAAFGALAAWSSYFVVAKRVNAQVDPTDFTISAAIVVAATNAPLALVFGQSLAWPGFANLAWILAMALGAGIFGHNLMNWALPRIPLWLGATFTLFVPVVSSALAWLWLGETLNGAQIAGMAITVVALGLLVWFQQVADAEDPPHIQPFDANAEQPGAPA